jgi:hypothetical protein
MEVRVRYENARKFIIGWKKHGSSYVRRERAWQLMSGRSVLAL